MTGTTVDPTAGKRYRVVLGCWLTQFTVIGVLFTYGLLFTTLEDEFGWSRTFLSSCVSLAFLMLGIGGIAAGRLSDRFGPGPVLGVSAVFFGLGYVFLSQASEPWVVLVSYGIFVGIGMSTHDVVTLSTIARWFDKRRGTMTGFVKVGTAAGQVAIPPLFAVMIANQGWRAGMLTLGLASLAVLLFAASLVKRPDRPAAVQDKAGNSSAGEPGSGFDLAWRSRVLWTLCAIQFCFLPSLTTVPVHIAAHGADMGINALNTAWLISVIGASSVAGRVAVGTLIDWLGVKLAFALALAMLFAGLGGILFASSPVLLFAATAVYGIAHGGLFTVVSPTIAAYFGMRAHGSLLGLVAFFGMVGGAIGPFLAGMVHDATDGYALAFGTLAAMALAGLVLVLTLPGDANAFRAAREA